METRIVRKTTYASKGPGVTLRDMWDPKNSDVLRKPRETESKLQMWDFHPIPSESRNWPNEEVQGQAVHAKNLRIFKMVMEWWSLFFVVGVSHSGQLWLPCVRRGGVHTLCCRTHIWSAHIRTSSCVCTYTHGSRLSKKVFAFVHVVYLRLAFSTLMFRPPSLLFPHGHFDTTFPSAQSLPSFIRPKAPSALPHERRGVWLPGQVRSPHRLWAQAARQDHFCRRHDAQQRSGPR